MADHTMLPSQKRMSSNAFYDLNISDSKPAIPLNEAKGSNKVGFLTLPVELRLKIYGLLVISQSDEEDRKDTVEQMNRKYISLDFGQYRQCRTTEPRILQTCKKIYREANPILYSQNVFQFNEPEQMIRFINEIGPVNLKLVKSLHIMVDWRTNLSTWLNLLDKLAQEANGLRCIWLIWGAYYEYGELPQIGTRERGFGGNLDFVCALGKIRGLEKLTISGYYAKSWPKYLDEVLGIQVRALCGYFVEERDLEKGKREKRELLLEQYIREGNQWESQRFIKYQQGIEDLML